MCTRAERKRKENYRALNNVLASGELPVGVLDLWAVFFVWGEVLGEAECVKLLVVVLTSYSHLQVCAFVTGSFGGIRVNYTSRMLIYLGLTTLVESNNERF